MEALDYINKFESMLETYREANDNFHKPLYCDSGLWQMKSDDMEEVLVQQGVNESIVSFINRCKNSALPNER